MDKLDDNFRFVTNVGAPSKRRTTDKLGNMKAANVGRMLYRLMLRLRDANINDRTTLYLVRFLLE